MKKKRWKWFAVLVGAVLAIGGIIAGTSTGESSKKIYGKEPVELSFFLRKREPTHIFETIIERFNQSQDEIGKDHYCAESGCGAGDACAQWRVSRYC